MTETKISSNSIIRTTVVCIVILMLSLVISVSFGQINDRNNMAKNIESAIAKGVDPLSVKCAYETNPTTTCITYAMSKK